MAGDAAYWREKAHCALAVFDWGSTQLEAVSLDWDKTCLLVGHHLERGSYTPNEVQLACHVEEHFGSFQDKDPAVHSTHVPGPVGVYLVSQLGHHNLADCNSPPGGCGLFVVVVVLYCKKAAALVVVDGQCSRGHLAVAEPPSLAAPETLLDGIVGVHLGSLMADCSHSDHLDNTLVAGSHTAAGSGTHSEVHFLDTAGLQQAQVLSDGLPVVYTGFPSLCN